MLKELRISNIILIEFAEIFFDKGLNVITGETGSGKSAILHALGLITGARADSSIIRKGAEKGSVEAYFEEVVSPGLKALLEDAGIRCESEDLVIKREILASGKSRGYINHQIAQVSLLKSMGEFLVDIVSQHASRHLLAVDSHRRIIDLFGGLEKEVVAFAENWEREVKLKQQIEVLLANESTRLREIETCQRELEELAEAALKEGEDESLFEEYSLLIHSAEITQKLDIFLNTFNGERSLFQHLNRLKTTLDELSAMDNTLNSSKEAFAAACIELQEVNYTLTAYQSRLDCDPERLDELNSRMTTISLLKKKYGASILEIQTYQREAQQKLDKLERSDLEIENLQAELESLAIVNSKLAASITEQRKAAAAAFCSAIIEQLRCLNMPKAEFFVEITPQKRTRCGDDLIEFYLLPNVGERKIPLRECASGGEISRILLALHVVLAGKEQIPTLFFDEIDEGIGGTTANLVGQKLSSLGHSHQVLCITHFPQVAKLADLHLQISRSEKEGRTSTAIEILDELKRQQELTRMVGF